MRISYYDIDRDGEKQTQSVNIDMFTDLEDFVATTEDDEYSIAVFTTGSRVRRSAEMYLLKQAQNQDTRLVFLAAKYLSIEPSDFISGIYRVHKTEIDSSLTIKVEAMYDDISNYVPVAGLEAPERDFVDRVQRDYDQGVANYPVGFMLPPIIENPDANYLYTALVNPNDSVFLPTEIFIRAQSSNPFSAGTPTAEAVFGRLVTPPNQELTAEFTSDKTGTMQIRFNKAIPTGALENLTSYLPMYQTYNENLLFVGRELIKYNSFSIGIDERTVTFTGLQRGRWGTDEHMRDHIVGEPCLVYIPTTRVLSSRIPFEAMAFNMIQSVTYDPRNPRIFKHEDTTTFDYLNRQWRVGSVQIFKQPPTGGISVQTTGRFAFQNSFADDGLAEATSFTTLSLYPYDIFVAILRAPFDIDDFMDNIQLPQIENEVIDFTLNPYIARLVAGGLYTNAQMITDGNGYGNDLHMAIFISENGEIISPVRGVRFEGDAIYTDHFKPGLLVY